MKKNDDSLNNKSSNFTLIFILFILIMTIFGYNYYNPVKVQNNLNNISINVDNIDVNLNKIKKFNSEEELINFLQDSKIQNNLKNSKRYLGSVDMMMDEPRIMVKSTKNLEFDGTSTKDFSTTNNYEVNVDEADIIKTDGKYIYTLSGKKLVIVDAFPAENLNILSEIKFEDDESPSNIFIYNNKLVVFTNSYEKEMKVSSYSFILEEFYSSRTNAKVYDLSNIEKPKLVNKFTLSGNFEEARLIGNYIYFISKESVSYYNDIIMPRVFVDNVKIGMPEVYYFGNYYSSYNFHNIASFNLENLDKNLEVKSFMLGYSDTIYFSENNIYISYPKSYGFEKNDILKNVIIPLLPVEISNKIINKSDSQKVIKILESYYNTLSESEKKNLFKKIEDSTKEYYYKLEIERDKTIIHKISIDNGKIKYVVNGEINGHLLNQFSLSEGEDDVLRVATTTSIWSRDNGRKQFNNVFILDSDLKIIGNLIEFAKDEKIYSTRFIGNKLYLVTFKQIDPLFVIDLSKNDNPKILGELKIPGYSTYLHPYDNNYLIGIGYDTKESEWGGVVNNGVKLSLFDISDFENPKEIDSYVVEGRYTDSIALHEHKAFLFSRDKNLISMPIREFIGDEKKREYIFENSAFVFNIDEKGFDLIGKVIHDKSKEGQYYWYNSPSSVKRSLYINNILYTVSDKYIYANELNDLNLVKKISLAYEDDNFQREIYY